MKNSTVWHRRPCCIESLQHRYTSAVGGRCRKRVWRLVFGF